jgi:hypothetical protein
MVKQKFAEMCPESYVPYRNTVWQFINKFREIGLVSVAPRSAWPTVSTENKVLNRGSRVRFLAEAGNFSTNHCVQNVSGAHPASYPMGTRGSFSGRKATGA